MLNHFFEDCFYSFLYKGLILKVLMTFSKKNYLNHAFWNSFHKYNSIIELVILLKKLKTFNWYSEALEKPTFCKMLKTHKNKLKNHLRSSFCQKKVRNIFFLNAKISKFSLKTCWFLKILASNQHKLILRPILHPQAPT